MDYYNTAIKAVIQAFPKVGGLLVIHGVDCATCSVGTCLLKDVLDVHNFPEEQKKTVMSQIESIINGEDLDLSSVEPLKERKSAVFSAPVQQLVDEHKNILRLLNLAQYIADKRQIDDAMLELSRQVVFYVRNYADKHHHAKEENILFLKADPDNQMVEAMLAEHEMARGFIQQASESVDSRSADRLRQALCSYAELLHEHIRKEDKILYPWFENFLSSPDKEEMQKEFEAADNMLGDEIVSSLMQFLDDNYA